MDGQQTPFASPRVYPCGAGIRLHVIPRTSFKTDYLTLRFLLPLGWETVSAYALLPAVLCRGCAAYPDLEVLSEALDTLYGAELGGRTRKCGDLQAVSFSLRTLEQACVPGEEDIFTSALGILSEVLFCPILEGDGFLSSYTESEKKNAIDALRERINHKGLYALGRCEEELCRGEPFGIPAWGTEETLSAVTPKQVYDAYVQMLRTAPLEIFYVGKRDGAALAEQLTAMFSHVERAPETIPPPSVHAAADTVRRVTEKQPVKQGKLVIGYRTDARLSSGTYYIFALFNELIGGCASSRLFLQVREEMGLCYDCHSSPDAYKGLMFVSCGMDPERCSAAEGAIAEQLSSIAAGEITERELLAAKKSLAGGYREIEDSAAALCSWYFHRLLAGISTSPGETAEQVMTVSKEAVAEAASHVQAELVYFLSGNGGETDESDGEEEEVDDVGGMD